MAQSIIKVDGMSCEHCVKAVTGAVGALPGVSDVVVDLDAKTVTIEHDPNKTDVANINSAIEDQGYDVIS